MLTNLANVQHYYYLSAFYLQWKTHHPRFFCSAMV